MTIEAHPDVALCATNSIIHTPDGRFEMKTPSSLPERIKLHDFSDGMFRKTSSTWLVRKEVFEKEETSGFDENLHFLENCELLIRVMKARGNTLLFLNDPLMIYKGHEDGKRYPDQENAVAKVFERHAKWLRENMPSRSYAALFPQVDAFMGDQRHLLDSYRTPEQSAPG